MEKQRHTEGWRVDGEKGEEKERLSVGHLLMPRLKAETPWKVLLPRRRQQQVWDTLPLVPFCRPQQQRYHRRRRHVAAARGWLSDSSAHQLYSTHSKTYAPPRKALALRWPPSRSKQADPKAVGLFQNQSKKNRTGLQCGDWPIGPPAHGGVVLPSSACYVPGLLGEELALSSSCILVTVGEHGFFSPAGFLRSCRASGWRFLLYDLH